jgi:hypothetical protein
MAAMDYELVGVPLPFLFRNGMKLWASPHHIYKGIKRNGGHISITPIEQK